MILKEILREIVKLQRIELNLIDVGVKRELIKKLDLNNSHVAIISGIRRCGKSTLLLQIMKKLDSFYYFKNQFECDFIVKHNHQIRQAYQVCHQLTEDNLKREQTGLKRAMEITGATAGFFLTFKQEDEIDGIPVIPVWKWCYESE